MTPERQLRVRTFLGIASGTLVVAAVLFFGGRFLDEVRLRDLARQELGYFRLAEHPCGLWVDHVRYDEGRVPHVGAYHSAAKSGLQIALCLRILGGAPGCEHGWCAGIEEGQRAARDGLGRALLALERFHDRHPACRGFVPWGRLQADGLTPDCATGGVQPCTMLPALDQGLLAFALLAAREQLFGSALSEERHLAERAGRLLARMDFRRFYDPLTGRLSGRAFVRGENWRLDDRYQLDDFSESVLAVLYGVLHEQVPEAAFQALDLRPKQVSVEERHLTTFRTWRGSWHEIGIPLLFVPLNEIELLRPRYQAYLAVQAADAARRHAAGFPATAYGVDGEGQCRYLQMGVAALAESGQIDSQSHMVGYASCLACRIDRGTGVRWALRYRALCPPGPYGLWESLDAHGRPARIYSTDAKIMTVLGLAGGVADTVGRYLRQTRRPGADGTLWDELERLIAGSVGA